MFSSKHRLQSIIGTLLLVFGIVAVTVAVLFTPIFVTNHLLSDHNITLGGIKKLNIYRFISSIIGILLIISGSVLMIVKDIETKLQKIMGFINFVILDEKRFKRKKFIAFFIGLIGITMLVMMLWKPKGTIAVISTLAIFLILGFSFYGWGTTFCKFFRINKISPEKITLQIWLGWAVTLFLFQVLHFVFPISAYVVVPIFFLGAVFSIPQLIIVRKSVSKRAKPLISTRIIKTRIITIIICALFVGASVWVAARSMLAPSNYDSALYHFNAIRWINSYPIIPGLGNLHGRLAFNQSFFVYVAALNFYPFFGYGRSIANSFLLLVLISQILISLRPAISQPSLLTKHPFHFAAGLFLIPGLAYLALTSDGLASPTPDLASTLLQLVIFVELTHGIAEWLEGQMNQDFRAFFIVLLSATAITVKLSNLAFSSVMIVIVIAYIWKTSLPLIRGLAQMILPVVVLLLVWGVRGFILSGAPLYPSMLGYIPVDWAVPKAAVVDEANSIYSWARQPNASPSSVLSNWDWLGPWSLRMSNHIADVVYPLAISIAFCTFAIILGTLLYVKKRSKPRFLESIIFLPPILGLIYWFFTAPDPRFANSVFWLLSISSSLFILTFLQRIIRKHYFELAFIIMFALTNIVSIGFFFVHYSSWSEISFSGWYPVKVYPLNMQTTDSGLVVYVPAEGDQCGDSPSPCTPYFDYKLRLRNPNNIALGFIGQSH